MDDYPVDSILVGAEEFVYTTHVTHQQLFYVHVETRSSILDEIMSKLETRYTHLRPEEKPLLNKRIGSLCAAKFTDDGVWYRAKITGLLKNGHIEVQFVDYGNTDYVTEERIKAIDADLIKYPVQSYRCCLADVSCPQGFWTPELIIQFEDRVIDRRCQAVFVGQTEKDEMYLLQMFDSEGNNINQLFGAASRPDKKHLQNGTSHGSGFRETSCDIGTVFQAAVVYVKSPGLFWCQNTQFASDILILSEELSRVHMVQEMKPLVDVRPGDVCAAKFSEDEAWYRGIVHSVSGNQAKVYFVDYGNTEVVSLNVVCNLKLEMRSMPALAIKCRLNNMDSKGREWRPEIIEAFEELVVDKEFEVKVVGKEGDVYVVTLFDVVDNKDVGAQLQSIMRSVNLVATNQDINCNKQIPSSASSGIGPSLKVGNRVDVYLSWVDSPGDFWVQLSSAEELLEQMSQQLQEVYSRQQPLAQPTPGAFVVAKFSQDGMWYRSLVLKVFEDGRVRVLFIDYGNSDIVPVTDLRQVTAAFGQVIPLASRCCLAGVRPLSKGDKSWGADAKNILEKLTDNGCQCELLSETNSLKIVSLKVGSRDVARELLNLGVVAESTTESKTATPLYWPELTVKQSETKEVVVTHIDSPKNFWCQITTNIPLLQDLTKQISKQYASGDQPPLEEPILGQACVVFSNQDKSWYRAKITNISSSTYGVHFVDYGSSDVVPKCNVFVAEPTLMALTAQAFQCCISVSSDSSLLTEAFKKAVFKKELRLQVLEVSGGKAVVELFDGRTKVSELLSGSKHASGEVDFVPAKKIPVGSTVKAFASFVVSPNKFFIQMTGVDVELADLMDNIALVYSSDDPPPAINSPHSGQPCVALFAEDDSWYRGQIVAVKGSACVVLFVDFGNEDTVSMENIRVLTPELAQVPVLAYRCSVHGVPETEWSEDALDYFESLIMEQELTCTFVTPSSVRVLIGTQDVASLVLKAFCGATPKVSSPGQSSLGRERESDSDLSIGSKLGQSGHPAKAGRGDESCGGDAWDNNEETGADSHTFGRRGEAAARSDRQFKYTDIRREELGPGDDRGSRTGGGRNGRDSRVEDVGRKDFGSGFGRDRGDGRGDRENQRGDRENQRGDRENQRGRDSRSETDRRSLHSGDHGDNGSRGGPYGRHVESGGFRDTGDRRGRESRFEGAPRRDFGSNDGRESDSSSGSRHEQNFRSAGARGREPDLGEDRRQGSVRFNGSRDSTFGKGHNDRRTTTGQALPDTNADFTYPEIPNEPESTVLVHMDEDGTFYLQLPSMEKEILFLSRRVAGSYKGGSGPRLRETPTVGTVCCAKFADDGNMYRAKVEDIHDGRAVLRYVDYGNTGECAFSDLKFLFPDLLQYSVQAFPCKLRGYNWSLQEAEKFAKATLDKELKVTFVGNTCPFEVDITTPEGDLLKILTGESAPPPQKLSPKPSGMSSRSAGFEKKSPSGGFGSRAPNSEGDTRKVSSSSPREGDTCELPSITLPKQVYSPQPPPQDTLAAVISHVGSDGFFYLQLTKDLPTLDSISEKLQVLPEDIKHPGVSPGASCAAVFSEDSAWYRARITETHGDSVSVFFVDYGNEDSVSAESIKPLSHELLAYPPLAYQSQFPERDAVSPEAQAKLAEYLTEHKVTVTFSGQSPPFNVCVKTEQGEDLQDVVCPLEKYRAPVVPSEVAPVGVTHIEDDGRFFVRLYQNNSAVTVLQDDLNNVAELESLNIESAQVEMPCCLKVDTGIWQRGKVIDIADESVHVFLVDSGKTVTTDVGSLRSLPVQFLKTPTFALECRLKGVEKWTGCLREKFSEMTQDKILNATFYNKTFPLRVSLARSIELDLLGLAAPPPDSPVKSPARKPLPAADQARQQTAPQATAELAEAKTSYISHVDTHGDFYVQTVAREEQLDDLADSLETLLSDSEHLQEVAAGDVVCAQFTEDNAWYRARIESCTDDGQFLIRFIDYGNSDVVGEDRLKALPQEVDISVVPAFAVKCRFFGVTNDLTPEQVDKFRETVADQTVKVAYKGLEDDIHEVELSLDGFNLAQLLGLDTQTTVPDLSKNPEVEEVQNDYCEAVLNLEKRETEPVVEKAADSGIMEAQVSYKCPGASSTDVVGSAIGAFEVVSSGESTEFVNRELESPSSAADVRDKAADTSKMLVSSNSTVEEAVSPGDSARISVSVDDRMEVIVSHVDSPHSFYMQLVGNQPGLDDMMNTIFDHFSMSESLGSLEAVCVGDVCAALFDDESWYRVRVDSVPGDGTCQIFYIDYGNTETVDVTSIRPLPERFQRMSPWAVKARLGGIAPVDHWTEEAVQELKKMVDKRHLLADVVQVSEDGSDCIVHLLYMGIPVQDELIKKGLAVAVDDGLVSKNLQHFYSDGDSYGTGARTDESAGCLESTHLEGDDTPAEDKPVSHRVPVRRTFGCVSSSLQELKKASVYVSHCSDSSGHFWCQLSSSSDLSEISSSLASIYGAPSQENLPTEPLCVGDLVVAVFDDDGELYRAQILSLEGSDGDSIKTVRVRFVDYGNEGKVSQDLVFKFDEKLFAWPAQAFCCCLDKVQPLEDTWSPKALQTLSEIVLHQELLLKLVGREQDGVILVDAVLQESGQSVGSLLVEAGLVKTPAAETQVGTSSKSLETSTAGEVSEFESLEMSQPILESTTMVGSSLAKRVPTVTFEEAGDHQFGSVKLSQHTEYDVIVSNDELPSSFHVQLLELRNQYLTLMSEIADHVVSNTSGETALFSQPELGDACLVQHCGLWYRGLVTARESDSWNVKSVDCGWTVNVSCDQLMALPAHLKELPALAVPCYLAGIVSVELEWATDGVSFFIDSVREAKLCMYVLECADDGKYGVYLSDLDNTSSQSVNRALVDLGYAEVVPGSNIEVQIEMERTLDTDMLQDLEESFNEVSQLKCNANCEWDEEGMSSITFDSENPLKGAYEDSDVCGTVKLEMDKTLYHLVQIPTSSIPTDEPDSEYKDCLPSKGGSVSSNDECPPANCETDRSEMVQFDCASAVDRIDKMGCVDNFPDEELFAEFESLGDAASEDDRHVIGIKDDVHQSQPDVTPHGEADEQAEIVPQSENDPAAKVQDDTEVPTLCAVKSEAEAAAAATLDSIEHSDPEIPPQAQETPPSAQHEETPQLEETPPSAQPVTASCDAGDDQEDIANQRRTGGTAGVSDIGLCGESSCVRLDLKAEASLQLHHGEVVLEYGLASEHGCGPGGIVLAEDAAASLGETDFRSRSLSVASISDEYESCCEDVTSQCQEEDDENNDSSFTENSIESHIQHNEHDESNYDTSTLLFSDTCVNSSMDVSSMFEISSTEASSVDSDGMYLDSFCDTYNTSAGASDSSVSSDTQSSFSSASTIVTSSGSLSDDSSWITDISSSSSGSSIQTATGLSFFQREPNSSDTGSDLSTGTALVCKKKEDRTSSVLLRSGNLTGGDQDPTDLWEMLAPPEACESRCRDILYDFFISGTVGIHTETDQADPRQRDTDTSHVLEEDIADVLHTDFNIPRIFLDIPGIVIHIPVSVVDTPGTVVTANYTPVGTQCTAVSTQCTAVDIAGTVDIPGTAVSIPDQFLYASGTVLDAPGTVLDTPGTVLEAPGTVVDAPGTVLDAPGTVLDEPGTILDETGIILDKTRTVPGTIGTVLDTPGTVLDAPDTVLDAPRTVLDAPDTVLDAPRTVLDAPDTVLDAPRTVLDAPDTVLDAPDTVLDAPDTVLDAPDTVLDAPDTVLDAPDTVLDAPRTVLDAPDTVLDAPDTVLDAPDTVLDAPDTVLDTPRTVLDAPDTVLDAPDTVLDAPRTVLDAPRTVLDAPDTVLDKPRTALDAPYTVLDTPDTVLDTPVTVLDTPVTALDTPVTALDTPVTVLDTPVTALYTPVTALDTPVTALDTPDTVLDTPVTALYTPVTALDTPVTALDTPDTVLDTLDTVLDTPDTVLDTPDTVLDTPVTALDTPDTVLDTPDTVLDTLDTVLDTPDTVLDTPVTALDTPDMILDTPVTALDTPDMVLDTPDTILDTPDMVLDTPDTALDTPDTALDTPDTILDTPVTALDTPDMILDTPVTALDTPDTILDTPVTALDTPVTALDTPVTALDTPDTVLDTPDSVLDNPDLVLDTPDTVLDTPDTVLDTPDTVLDTPDTVLDTPDTVLDTPDTVLDTPDTVLDTPDTVLDTPDTVLDTLDTVLDIPDTVLDIPDTVLDTPDTVLDTPDTVLDTPDTVLDTPDTVLDTPDTVLDTPYTVLDTPVTALDTPDMILDTPVTALDTPDTILDTPVTALDTPVTALDTPVTVLDTPDTVLDTPDSVLDNPDLVLDTPDTVLDTPDTVLDTPDTVLDTPDTILDTPDTVLDTPDTVLDTPDTVLDTPDTVLDTPDTVLDTPDTVLDTPDTVLDIPDTVLDTPDTVLDTPDTVLDTPDTVLDTPDTVLDTPDTVLDTPDTVLDTPYTVLDTPDTVLDTPDTVLDTPDTVLDTPYMVLDTPDTVLDTPDTLLDTPEKLDTTVLDTAGTVLDTPRTVLDTPGTVLDTPGTVLDTPGTVLDTAGTVLEIPKVIPGTEIDIISSGKDIRETGHGRTDICSITETVEGIPKIVNGTEIDIICQRELSSGGNCQTSSPCGPEELPFLRSATDTSDWPGEATPTTVPDLTQTVDEIDIDRPDLSEADSTENCGEKQTDIVEVPSIVYAEDTVENICGDELPTAGHDKRHWTRGMNDMNQTRETVVDVGVTPVLISLDHLEGHDKISGVCGTNDINQTHETVVDVGVTPVLISLDRLEGHDKISGVCGTNDINQTHETVVDVGVTPVLISLDHLEGHDKISGVCGTNDINQSNETVAGVGVSPIVISVSHHLEYNKTSRTHNMKDISHSHKTIDDIGVTPVQSANHCLEGLVSGHHWQMTQQPNIPCDNIPAGNCESSSCRFPTFITVTGGAGAGTGCLHVVNKIDDQDKAVSLKEGKHRLQSSNNMLATGDKSGVCGGVGDTKTTVGDVGCRQKALDSVCGCQLAEDEVCGIGPDARVSDEGSGGEALSAAVFGHEVIESICPDARISDGALDTAVFGHEVIESICPDARISDGALDTAVFGHEVIESICPDARISDGALDTAVFGHEVIESICPDTRISDEPFDVSVSPCQVVENEVYSSCPDARVTDMAGGDVALHAADYGCALTESQESSICPDGKISDTGYSSGPLNVCGPDLETNEMCVGESPDAVTPQGDITTSDRDYYPATLALYGADREHEPSPSYDDVNNVQSSKNVKEDEQTVHAAGDAGPCVAFGQEEQDTPEA